MNGYKIQADSYRAVLERDRSNLSEESIKDMERSIRVFDVLADFEQEDKYKAFDSSMFNDIFKGYVQIIIDELCEADEDEIKKAAEEIRSLITGKASSVLDRINAKEAESYYMTH